MQVTCRSRDVSPRNYGVAIYDRRPCARLETMLCSVRDIQPAARPELTARLGLTAGLELRLDYFPGYLTLAWSAEVWTALELIPREANRPLGVEYPSTSGL